VVIEHKGEIAEERREGIIKREVCQTNRHINRELERGKPVKSSEQKGRRQPHGRIFNRESSGEKNTTGGGGCPILQGGKKKKTLFGKSHKNRLSPSGREKMYPPATWIKKLSSGPERESRTGGAQNIHISGKKNINRDLDQNLTTNKSFNKNGKGLMSELRTAKISRICPLTFNVRKGPIG